MSLIILGCAMLGFHPCIQAEDAWWNKDWHYRIPVTIDAGLYDRENYLIRLPLDLKQIASKNKLAAEFELDSLRVIEVHSGEGKLAEIPSVFKPGAEGSTGVTGTGFLIWRMEGKVLSMGRRFYHVYFDPARKGAPAYGKIPGADEETGINLVPNPSFEEVDEKGLPAGWQKVLDTPDAKTVGTVEATDQEAHTGKHSLHFSKPTQADGMYFCCHGSGTPVPPEPIQVKPGKRYQLGGWTKCADSDVALQFGFANERWGALTEYAYTTHITMTPSKDWQQGKCVLVAPPGSYYAFIRLHHGKKPGDSYFDDVELIQLPDEEPVKITTGATENTR